MTGSAILFSIPPERCEQLLNRKVNIILTKKLPKFDSQTRGLLYCQLPDPKLRFYNPSIHMHEYPAELIRFRDGTIKYGYAGQLMLQDKFSSDDFLCKKVIADFSIVGVKRYETQFWNNGECDRISEVVARGNDEFDYYPIAINGEIVDDDPFFAMSGCTWDDIHEFVGDGVQTFYAIEVSDFSVFTIPHPVEFYYKPCPNEKRCENCKFAVLADPELPFGELEEVVGCTNLFKRPPRDWAYVD